MISHDPHAQSDRPPLLTTTPCQVKPVTLTDNGVFPNNPTLPLLLYPSALTLPRRDAAAAVIALFAENHWSGAWTNGVYDIHHYHSTAHEVLACVCGSATVQFGGPRGAAYPVHGGDAVVIPAGVAHKNLTASADFTVVGAYPHGQRWDMCYGEPDERPRAAQHIARVPLPQSDPLYGPQGPLMQAWNTPPKT